MIEPFTDLDSMPFGKYKGTPLQDIPASYLHYLWLQFAKSIKPESEPKSSHELHSYKLAMYIRKSVNALKEELPDALW